MKLIAHLFTAFLLCISVISQAQGKTPTIRVNHVAFYVTDLAISTRFYHNIVGLDTIPEPFHDKKHTWFSIGDKAHLHLIQGRTTEPVPSKNTHICFSTSRLDEIVALLKKENIHFEDWPGTPGAITKRVDGIRQIYFKDPDGYWIEINDDFQP